METRIDAVFEAISDDTVSEETSLEEKITKIMQTLQQYKEHIKELEERTIPMTPPAVRAQREKDVTTAVQNITQNIQRMAEMLEKSGQLWTRLLEYGSLQELQGK
jgi:Mg2+ and Co2+ transporter CorA